MPVIIDLIYVTRPSSRTMSIAILLQSGEAEMIGPVPAVRAVSILAPMLMERFPDMFASLDEAVETLALLHVSNFIRTKNLAGQPYPFEEEDGL